MVLLVVLYSQVFHLTYEQSAGGTIQTVYGKKPGK